MRPTYPYSQPQNTPLPYCVYCAPANMCPELKRRQLWTLITRLNLFVLVALLETLPITWDTAGECSRSIIRGQAAGYQQQPGNHLFGPRKEAT